METKTQAELCAIEQKKLDDYVRSLSPLIVTLPEMKGLLEYSSSLPTGTTPGKLWRRHMNSFWTAFIKAGGKPRWIIGEYDPTAKPYDKDDKSTHSIDINWYRPVIRVKAAPSHGATVGPRT